MWKNIILVKREDYNAPSDINNDEYVGFSHRMIDGKDPQGIKAQVARLAQQLIDCSNGSQFSPPFDHLPLTTAAVGSLRVYNRFSKAVTPDLWSDILNDADEEIILASTKLEMIWLKQRFSLKLPNGKREPTTIGALLLAKALTGVKVKILMYHEDNLNLGWMKQQVPASYLENVRNSITGSWNYWAEQKVAYTQSIQNNLVNGGTQLEENGFEVIQVQNRMLPYRVTMTEKRCLVTLRFFTEIYNSGICIDATPASHRVADGEYLFYHQIRDELNFLMDENREQSEFRFRQMVG